MRTVRTMTSHQAKAIADAPSSSKRILERAYTCNSKATAVKAKCLECCGFVRMEVTHCGAETCPIWPHRPFQKGSDDADLNEDQMEGALLDED